MINLFTLICWAVSLVECSVHEFTSARQTFRISASVSLGLVSLEISSQHIKLKFKCSTIAAISVIQGIRISVPFQKECIVVIIIVHQLKGDRLGRVDNTAHNVLIQHY